MVKYVSLILVLFLITAIYTGCNSEVTKPESSLKFQIDLQSGFSNTHVKLSVDNNILLDEYVTTGKFTPYAAIVPTKISKGNHTINVDVDKKISKQAVFTITDSLFVGIDYVKQNSDINFNFRKEQFFYL